MASARRRYRRCRAWWGLPLHRLLPAPCLQYEVQFIEIAAEAIPFYRLKQIVSLLDALISAAYGIQEDVLIDATRGKHLATVGPYHAAGESHRFAFCRTGTFYACPCLVRIRHGGVKAYAVGAYHTLLAVCEKATPYIQLAVLGSADGLHAAKKASYRDWTIRNSQS